MNISCQDRERIFLDGSAEEWSELELHAAGCSQCAGEIRAWKALGFAAQEMRDYREDPVLWARIETSLKHHNRTGSVAGGFWARFAFWKELSLGWQTALVGALVLLLAISAARLYLNQIPPKGSEGKLLRNSALAEVERTEREYIKAIDHLAADAKPQLESPATPLMANYREKLVVLDSAIEELRTQAGRNQSNAHLRYQLLAMYREKQETLHEVLETKP